MSADVMGPVALRDLSERLEDRTGYDSIPTIERVYENNGRYLCPFPGCTVAKTTPELMWHHVHFSRTHGLSFGVRTAQAAAAAYFGGEAS